MSECWLNITEQDFCDCPDRKSEDLSVCLDHLMRNFLFQGWLLKYDTLDAPGADSCLCRAGRCRKCGKRLCAGTSIPPDKAGDSFLAAVYRWMYQIWSGMWLTLPEPFKTFQEMFLEVFHEADRPFIAEWLKRPENSDVLMIYRH